MLEVMQATQDRAAKGQRRMSGLVREIGEFWNACAEVVGHVAHGGDLHIDSLDDVANALDRALITIRTIDLEVLDASDPTAYRKLRETDLRGRAVRALVAPRNSAVHHPDAVDPDVDQAIGPIDQSSRYVILPRWKARSALPARMFEVFAGKRKGQHDAKLARSYDLGAAGRPIMDTLLDAYGFFDTCDPTLALRNAHGQLVGFPFPPLPVANRYRRLHPDWPSEHDWDVGLRGELTSKAPSGQDRHVVGVLRDGSSVVLCGWTSVASGCRESFTEPAHQVGVDIGRGYRYWLEVSGVPVDLDVDQGRLVVAGTVITNAGLPDWTNDESQRRWSEWWELCRRDADFYGRRRRAS
jgi:hypothetical protein